MVWLVFNSELQLVLRYHIYATHVQKTLYIHLEARYLWITLRERHIFSSFCPMLSWSPPAGMWVCGWECLDKATRRCGGSINSEQFVPPKTVSYFTGYLSFCVITVGMPPSDFHPQENLPIFWLSDGKSADTTTTESHISDY